MDVEIPVMNKSDVKYIVIHHTATEDTPDDEVNDIEEYHETENNWSDIGYHFVVEKSNKKYVVNDGRPLDQAGAHTPGYNYKSIGIAHVGNFEKVEPEFLMLDKSSRKVSDLCIDFQVEIDNILPHNEVKNTKCPGRKFPMNEYKKMVVSWLVKGKIEKRQWNTQDIQRSLNLIGIGAGPVDGIMGDKTERGIKTANGQLLGKDSSEWNSELQERVKHELQLLLYSGNLIE